MGVIYDVVSYTVLDVNECMTQELNDCTQACINLYGNYTCACNQKGYTLHRDGITCQRMFSSNLADHVGCVVV